MKFKKGDPKPPGSGRKLGTPHKKSLLVQDILESHGINLIDQILVRLKELKQDQQVDALIQLLPYCYPKLTALAVSGQITNPYLEKSLEELTVLVKEELKLVTGPTG